MRSPFLCSIACALSLAAVPATAQEPRSDTLPDPLVLAPLEVQAERVFSTAASRTIRALDLTLRPRRSSQDLLALVPGLVVAQHAGGGKAEQIFLRGFDADHGTDVALSVDGTPVNMVSHAHGQGYSDLHFLIPEVVERVEVRKGPYDASDGDFATAGAVSFRTRDRIARARVGGDVGSFATRQALLLAPLGGAHDEAGGYLAASALTSDGPFALDQEHRRVNLFAKGTAPVSSGTELVVSGSLFDAEWRQSGQIPVRAVEDGRVDRFGSIDDSEGGSTRRMDLAAGLRSREGSRTTWEARAWAVRYDFRLLSNFTFFLNDPERGDGIEQVDDRWVGGVQGQVGRRSAGAAWTAGAGVRSDRATVGLHDQESGVRFGTKVFDDVDQDHAFAWARVEREVTDRLRLQIGLRADGLRFEVRDLRSAAPADLEWRAVVSPRASLAFDAGEGTTLFLSSGRGFHSNHARDVVLAGPDQRVLPRALGAETGIRHSWRGGTVAASAWGLDLESELLWVGDEGVTEPSGRTRRVGLDLELRAELLPRLWADLDLSASHGRFVDAPQGEDMVPLAPTLVATGGLTLRDQGPWDLGLRARRIGSRPADESGRIVALGSTLVEAHASVDVGPAELRLAVDNLFDTAWNEAQFATTSRLPGEPTGGVNELHFTPGAPRAFTLGVHWRFE